MGMTREETVRNLLSELTDMIDNGSQRDLDRADEIGASIIKLFEQEPTTKNDLGVDCISRADAIKGLGEQPYVWTDSDYEIQQLEDWKAHKEMLENLPSVTPQEPKTGHWVHGEYCSECGCDVPAYIIDWKWQKDMDAKYCPNCGAKMVEPQESENKK